MEREIKFRGQRIDTKEWVYGSFINARRTNVNIELTGEYKSIIQDESNLPYQVIPKTVGQYLVFKDKNKKEIYEWDIVMFPDCYDSGEHGQFSTNHYGVIVFINGAFQVRSIMEINGKPTYEYETIGIDLDLNPSDCYIIATKFDKEKIKKEGLDWLFINKEKTNETNENR